MINQHNIEFVLFNGVLWGVLAPLITFLIFTIKSIRESKFASFLSILNSLLSLSSAIFLCAWTSPIVPSIWTAPWFDNTGMIWFELGFYLDSVSVTMGLFAVLFAFLWQIKIIKFQQFDDHQRFGRFVQSHALCLLALQVLAYAPSFFQLALGLILSSMSMLWLSSIFTRTCNCLKFDLTQIANLGFLAIPFFMSANLGSFDWEISTELAIDQLQIKHWTQVLGFAWVLMIFLKSASFFQTPHHALSMLALGAFSIIRTWPFFLSSPESVTSILGLSFVFGIFGIFYTLKADTAQTAIHGLGMIMLTWVFSALGITHPDGAYLALFTNAAAILSLLFLADIRSINQMPKINAYLWLVGLCVAFALPLGLAWGINLILEGLFTDSLYQVIACFVILSQSVLSFKVVSLMKADQPSTDISMSVYQDLLLLPLMLIYTLMGFFYEFFDIKWALYSNLSQNDHHAWMIALPCILIGSLMGYQIFIKPIKE